MRLESRLYKTLLKGFAKSLVVIDDQNRYVFLLHDKLFGILEGRIKVGHGSRVEISAGISLRE